MFNSKLHCNPLKLPGDRKPGSSAAATGWVTGSGICFLSVAVCRNHPELFRASLNKLGDHVIEKPPAKLGGGYPSSGEAE